MTDPKAFRPPFFRSIGRPRNVPATAPEPTVTWVAHAGLASGLPGRVPTKTTIERAIDAQSNMIELDVTFTKDLVPVVFHDVYTSSRKVVRSLTLKQLQLEMPSTLTLDECLSYVNGRVPVLLDLKLADGDEDALKTLSQWLTHRVDDAKAKGTDHKIAVCSKDLVALGYLQRVVPEIPRWITLPQVSGRPRQIVNQVIALLWKHRKEIGWEKARGAIKEALQDLPKQRRMRYGNIVKLPWQGLENQIGDLAATVGAAGFTVQHNLVTPELCKAAQDIGLPVIAWVVNNAKDLRIVRDAGVWGVTTDRVTQMQAADKAIIADRGSGPGLAA